MPGEEKDDPPAKRKSEGIAVFLRMRPTKQPSKFYDVGENEGRGQSLRWDIQPDAVTKDGEYIYNTKTQWAFKFDQVLPMDISQAQVFDRVGKHVVQNALDGYNSTVFAYGQTGSGKTFTITGGSERYEDRGIIPRALSMIFQEFRSRSDCSWSAHISYMEIYNEQGFDLLNESSGVKALQDLPRVRMMEDEHGNFHLRNLSMHRATSEEEALNLLFLGDTNRAISETAMNQASSRSHCLFTVFLECRGAGGSDKVRRSKLHLVDLAGSERVHKTKSDGITLNEAKYINTSLFYLEMVIVALNEKNKKARDHIPYRNSMMTSVLRDSLGGNCRTVMIATCSAEKPQTEESISTCRFAQRVALVKNDAVLNEETDPSVTIARLKSEVSTLRAEIASLRARLEGQGRGDELADGRDPDHRLAAALGRIRLQEAALADVRATTSRFFGFEIEEEEMRARMAAALEPIIRAEPLAMTGLDEDPAQRQYNVVGGGGVGVGAGERGATRRDGGRPGREVEARLVSDRSSERVCEPPAVSPDSTGTRENRLRRQLEAARSRMRKHEQMRDWLLRRRREEEAAALAEEEATRRARMREEERDARDRRRRAVQKRKMSEEYYVLKSTRATETTDIRSF